MDKNMKDNLNEEKLVTDGKDSADTYDTQLYKGEKVINLENSIFRIFMTSFILPLITASIVAFLTYKLTINEVRNNYPLILEDKNELYLEPVIDKNEKVGLYKNKVTNFYEMTLRYRQGSVAEAFVYNLCTNKNIYKKVENVDINNRKHTIKLKLDADYQEVNVISLSTLSNNENLSSDYFVTVDTLELYIKIKDYHDRIKEYLIIILPKIDIKDETKKILDEYKKIGIGMDELIVNDYLEMQYKIIDLSSDIYTTDFLISEIDSLTYKLPLIIDFKDKNKLRNRYPDQNFAPTLIWGPDSYTKPNYEEIEKRLKSIRGKI